MGNLKLTKIYDTHPEYKDSGVEWIGNIPSKWNVVRAKTLFKKAERTPLPEDEIVTAFRDGTVTLRKNRREDGFTMADKEIGYQRILKGDLVIHGMDAFAGAIGVSDSDGKSSPVYSACIPVGRSNTKYYAHLLRHMSQSQFIFALAKGIRERSTEFRFKEFANLMVVSPDPIEQEIITDHLDKKVSLIDQIIEKKQKQIELLRERRTAVINQAVTRGLDSKGELVESGVEWLGKISIKFRIVDLRYLVKVSTGNNDTANAVEEGMYPFFVRSPYVERINSYSFNGEAVLTAGDGAGVGKVFHYYNGKFDYHQRVYCFSRFKNVLGKFFYYYLMSNLKRVVLMGESKSTVDSIRQPQLLGLPVVVPDEKTQAEIVDFLDQTTRLYDSAIVLVEQSIALLQEFKSSLISHVVTGKVKIN